MTVFYKSYFYFYKYSRYFYCLLKPFSNYSYLPRIYVTSTVSPRFILLLKPLMCCSWSLSIKFYRLPPSICIFLSSFYSNLAIIASFCLIFSLYLNTFYLYRSSSNLNLASLFWWTLINELKFSTFIFNLVFSKLSFCLTEPLRADLINYLVWSPVKIRRVWPSDGRWCFPFASNILAKFVEEGINSFWL